MFRPWFLALSCSMFFLVGCDQSSKVNMLENKVLSLEKEIQNMQAEMESMKVKIVVNRVLEDLEKNVYLTPGSDKYSIVKSDLGILTVSIENIVPYANGSKVTLQFGNLSSATIDGLKATLEWGAVDEKDLPDNEHAKSREISFNESLVSGAWTNSKVVLEGVPPQELGFVRLKNISHRGIRLRK